MDENIMKKLPQFLAVLGLDEAPMGIYYTDPEVVASPWGAGCGSIVVWPLHYLSKGQNKAVIGGWDPSARKFFKTDELSFTVPFAMFEDMLNRYKESFLTTKTWSVVQKKILRSKKAWGESP